MKKIFLTLTAVVAVFAVAAQNNLNGFVFPEFKSGVVHYRNGTTSSGSFNYDGIYGKMAYIQNGITLYMGNSADISKIVVGTQTFVPVKDNAYYEEIDAGKGKFYVNHKVIMKDASANTGYGGAGTGGGMAVSTSTMVFGNANSMAIPAERYGINSAEVEPKKEFYLYSNGSYRSFNNVNQIANVYGHKKEISDFARANRINFKDTDSLKKIIEYAASL